MPSNYVGNPTATEVPAAAPGYGVDVTLALPVGGEPATVSSVLQPLKVLADWVAWARDKLFTLRGIYAWLSSVTYNAGNVVIDNLDQHIYRALSTNGNMQPSTSPSVWSRIDWSAAEVEAMTVVARGNYSGITTTNGATVDGGFRFSYNGDEYRRIELAVGGVPANGSTIIDLSACAGVKFASYCRSGTVSMTSGGFGFGGQVGLNMNIDGNPNRVLIWYKRGMGDSAATAGVGVTLIGA